MGEGLHGLQGSHFFEELSHRPSYDAARGADSHDHLLKVISLCLSKDKLYRRVGGCFMHSW